MTLEELREQIQEDLRTYLEDNTGSRRIIDNTCQIVVDNFKKFKE